MKFISILFQALSLVLVLSLVSIIYKAVAQLLKRTLRAKLTALDDLPLLSYVRNDDDKIQGTVVICGGRFVGPNSLKNELGI